MVLIGSPCYPRGTEMPRARTKRAAMLAISTSADQNQARGPGLPMPVVVRGDGVGVNHDRQRGGRLRQLLRPELIVESGEQQRSGLAGDARHPRIMPVRMPLLPRARPPSRSSSTCWRPTRRRLRAVHWGTSRRNCSVCRVTIGISIRLRAIDPARRKSVSWEPRPASRQKTDHDGRHAVQQVRGVAHHEAKVLSSNSAR